ncbi:NAD(P)-binding oxidoreductase [Pediococcus claussenii]|uniref:NAD(P)-binding domain-containing protein n=1 Tax=Pediococcus claussenii (strain ATCC BAA-344 / DSM 14800 / JCM 18046 / KCTC 3811 / LMG 21948 / P06) TaxID=701521 RepID=G8PB97_PEDCP|nr:NAD(P)-binding oxidoreductase [Pediococcus claussenii]AEV95886.1 hypothetical protein PECL_1669 [Pediococcus claussenii ATCC BAA-344]ANZ69380.1 hypothetical protein AYR57_03250 [Pediococcus claussenii]ANZ71200.1 hypothetical protein AYR58_03265 [Pediococcus claussenii]KRN20493.1 hypothetical protein IV79_GL000548 [Pediococcus claussenii]
MRVLVIGANGKTGLDISERLLKSGVRVSGSVHSEHKEDLLTKMGVTILKMDLMKESINQLAEKMTNIDAVVFAAGASQERADLAVWIDLDGMVKTVEAAKKAGIERYIMISAAGAESRDTWNIYDIPLYYVSKYYAEQWLENSGMKYTIIRPAILTDEDPTNMVGLKPGNPYISRKDVANVTEWSLKNMEAVNKAFNLYQGSIPVSELGEVSFENE